MKTLVLGAGKMVEGILVGMAHKKDLRNWGIYSPSGTSAKILAAKTGAQHVTDLSQFGEPQLVLVGCKPQQLPTLKDTLGGRFKDALYVSMLAAVSEEDQRRLLGVNQLIRMMPNLPVRFGAGVVLFSSRSARSEIDFVIKEFAPLGECIASTEDELEELTLLTGSGPALFYEFTKLLAAQFNSLNEEKREKLAKQVLAGAGAAVQTEKIPLESMIDAVTSKGGVTIAILEKWREEKLDQLIGKGIEAGKERTQQIKDLLRQS